MPTEPVERGGLEALTPEEALKLKSYYEDQTGLVEVEADLSSFHSMVRLHQQCCEEALKLMIAKNHDYAGGNPLSPDYDFFKNFRRNGGQGILVRLGDKLSRLETFLANGKLEVGDEKLEDTVHDVINYAVILLGWLRNQNKPL